MRELYEKRFCEISERYRGKMMEVEVRKYRALQLKTKTDRRFPCDSAVCSIINVGVTNRFYKKEHIKMTCLTVQ